MRYNTDHNWPPPPPTTIVHGPASIVPNQTINHGPNGWTMASRLTHANHRIIGVSLSQPTVTQLRRLMLFTLYMLCTLLIHWRCHNIWQKQPFSTNTKFMHDTTTINGKHPTCHHHTFTCTCFISFICGAHLWTYKLMVVFSPVTLLLMTTLSRSNSRTLKWWWLVP